MIGYILTTEQKDLLIGRQFTQDSYFNPVQDINDNWFIFDQEVDECEPEDLQWVKMLTPSEYIPKVVEES